MSLLASLYKRILIPAEVRYEVTVVGCGPASAEECGAAQSDSLKRSLRRVC